MHKVLGWEEAMERIREGFLEGGRDKLTIEFASTGQVGS